MADSTTWTAWVDVTRQAFQEMWQGVILYLPKIIIAIIVFIVGWIIAVGIEKLIIQILRALKVNQMLERIGAARPFERAGIKLDIAYWIGVLVKWFVIFVFLIAASNILNLEAVSILLKDILDYIPNVVVAAVVMIVGIWAANLIFGLIKTGATAGGQTKAAGFAANIAKWAILITVFFAVINQLKILAILGQLFTGIIAMLAIAGGIAFGLGGKDLAAELLAKWKNEMSE